MSTPTVSTKFCFQTAEQNCVTLNCIWGKEHDILVDSKSATGNNRNTLFLQDEKYRFKKGAFEQF